MLFKKQLYFKKVALNTKKKTNQEHKLENILNMRFLDSLFKSNGYINTILEKISKAWYDATKVKILLFQVIHIYNFRKEKPTF